MTKDLRKICDEATAGPWNGPNTKIDTKSHKRLDDFFYVIPDGDGPTNSFITTKTEADSRFCVEARTALPAALDLIEKLKGALEVSQLLHRCELPMSLPPEEYDTMLTEALAAVKEFEGE